MLQSADTGVRQWMHREAIAESMIPTIGKLFRERNIAVTVFGRGLVGRSTVEILKAHRYVRRITGDDLPPEQTNRILQAIAGMRLAPAQIDIGRLARRFAVADPGDTLVAFLESQLAGVRDVEAADDRECEDVVLYGFGRIGRLVARLLIEGNGNGRGLRLRAIVVRRNGEGDLRKRASLLRRDSVHGPFHGTIRIDEAANTMIVNGVTIQVIHADDPAAVDYASYGIRNAFVVDNTGRWRDAAGLRRHLRSPGAAKVLLTAPGTGGVLNVVAGVNDDAIGDDDTVLSAASCTTNAIVPVLRAVDGAYGIVHGHIESVHSYTNDQNLIDNAHASDRRGRAATLNLVVSETGAARAVERVLPELAGRLTGNAIRVPTPNVSIAVLHLTLERPATKSAINEYLRRLSLDSDLQEQIDFIDSPDVVSSDFVGSRRAGIVDGLATIASDRSVVLYVWYDNEFGYSCQVLRVMQSITGMRLPVVPAEDDEVRPSAGEPLAHEQLA